MSKLNSLSCASFFTVGAATDPIYCNTRDGCEDHHARGRDYL